MTPWGLSRLLKPPKRAPGQDPAAVKAPPRPAKLVPDQVAEIRSPDFPGERLLVCLNPRPADYTQVET